MIVPYSLVVHELSRELSWSLCCCERWKLVVKTMPQHFESFRY
jgi:hypothetical protein